MRRSGYGLEEKLVHGPPTEVCSPITAALVARVRARDPALAKAILQRFALPDDPEALRKLAISLPRFRRFCSVVAEALGDPFAGLNAAIDLPRGTHGLLEFTIRAAPNVRSALEQLSRNAFLINSVLRYEVVFPGGGRVHIFSRVEGERECLGREANEFVTALFLKVGRQIAGRAFDPARVWFAHKAPPDVSALARFFGTSAFIFDAGMNGFDFDAALLDLPIPTADGALYSCLDREASNRTARVASDELEAIRDKIRDCLRSGEPAIERVATMLGTSARTLQRRLAERGTTFRRVVDDVRAALASLYVRDQELPLSQVAFLLGYSDVRAFVRAHKRWSGTTPAAVRRAAGAGPEPCHARVATEGHSRSFDGDTAISSVA